MVAFRQRPPIAVRLSTAGPSLRSLSIQTIRIPFTLAPFALCAALAPSSSGGVVTLAPGLPPYGFWKSTDGGANFTLLNYQDVCLNPDLPGSAGIIQASFGSTRGVHEVALDPNSASIVYAAPFPSNNVCPNNVKAGCGVRVIAAQLDSDEERAECDAKYRSGVVRCHADHRRIYANVRGRGKLQRTATIGAAVSH